MLLIQGDAPPSPARTRPATRPTLVVGLVQVRWRAAPTEHRKALRDGVLVARDAGAQVVFLPELTLSRYPADTRPRGDATAGAETLPGGPTHELAAGLAAEAGIPVHASLFERAELGDGLGHNTAILVAPSGELLCATRKLHIPRTAGYYEDHYFRPGPARPDPYPVVDLTGNPAGPARLGLPTCWDEWFPEVARAYALDGADILAYPTAIGSEPDHPDFDTEPLWRQVIVANGIANGLFMVVPNRWGREGLITFYGSSFISDPYGRILAQAPRDGDAALVAPLDLDQRRDWLELFPFFGTRRPDTYHPLTATSAPPPAVDAYGESAPVE